MLKTILLCVTCSAVTLATVIYSGRTVHSSPFQLDIPYGAGLKVAQDPANVWSWHHDFHNVSNAAPVTANVLVDFDGNGVMDTENDWLRVVVTDIELVSRNQYQSLATISDGTGKRYSVCAGNQNPNGGGTATPWCQHVSLATPIVLPVGSPLQVTLENFVSANGEFEVNLIGRIVSL
jgi:hypothetical protein